MERTAQVELPVSTLAPTVPTRMKVPRNSEMQFFTSVLTIVKCVKRVFNFGQLTASLRRARARNYYLVVVGPALATTAYSRRYLQWRRFSLPEKRMRGAIGKMNKKDTRNLRIAPLVRGDIEIRDLHNNESLVNIGQWKMLKSLHLAENTAVNEASESHW